MKYKIIAIIILATLTFGSIALADYVEPVSLSSNTDSVLKSGPKNTPAVTYEKIGIWDGNPNNASNFVSSLSTRLSGGSYAGSNDGLQGAKPDRLVVSGVSSTYDDKDFIVAVSDIEGSFDFDQFVNNNSVTYSKFINNSTNPAPTTPKPLEAIVAGRYVSNFAVTSNLDLDSNTSPNTYSLELRRATGFTPTTNIGLGNTCNLYPVDLGASIGDGGGCPAGSYMIKYIGPSFSGTPSSTNNTNTQVVAKCAEFNPAINPVNTGHCGPENKVFSNIVGISKTPIPNTNLCEFETYNNGNSGWPTGNPGRANITGKNVQIRWYALGGNPARSYINTLDNQESFTYGCGQDSWEVEIYDDYGQYARAIR